MHWADNIGPLSAVADQVDNGINKTYMESTGNVARRQASSLELVISRRSGQDLERSLYGRLANANDSESSWDAKERDIRRVALLKPRRLNSGEWLALTRQCSLNI